jgi:hypothetical protein
MNMEKQGPFFTVLMNQLPRATSLLMVTSILVLAASCISPQKAVPPPTPCRPAALPPQMILAPMPILAQRIQVLENDLKEKKMSQEDHKTAEHILKTYRQLQIASSRDLTLEDREKLIQALFNSLYWVEEKYFDQRAYKVAHLKRDQDIYIGEFPLPPRKKGIPKSAETVAVVESPIQIPEKRQLKPIKPIHQAAPITDAKPQNETALDLNALLKEVDSLVRSRNYEGAVGLLSKAEKEAGAGSAREIILRTKEHIEAEKETAPVPENSNDMDTRKIGEEAKNLIEEEKFEEAIIRLETIEDSRHESDETQLSRLKDHAVSGLINQERNRAADLFLKSKKIDDPALKREALNASRDILADLILSHPNSSLIRKVKQNLEVVEQALEGLQ